MKRYLLFAWAAYDGGACGWAGFKSAHDSEEEAKRAGEHMTKDYSELADVVDLQTLQVVWSGERDLGNRPGAQTGPLIWRKGT